MQIQDDSELKAALPYTNTNLGHLDESIYVQSKQGHREWEQERLRKNRIIR